MTGGAVCAVSWGNILFIEDVTDSIFLRVTVKICLASKSQLLIYEYVLVVWCCSILFVHLIFKVHIRRRSGPARTHTHTHTHTHTLAIQAAIKDIKDNELIF